jgi:hypothetical protein
MDARPVALVAGAALAAWLFVSLQGDLARLGARWEARALASAAYAAMAAGWTAVLLRDAPTWLAWVATAGAFAVTVTPRALVRVPRLRTASFRPPPLTLPGFARSGGARANRLAAEVGAIRLSMSTLTTSSHERAELRARVERLQRWRATSDPEARELVELVQEAVLERLDGVESDVADGGRGLPDDRYGAHDEAARQRERRIRELLTRLAR